MRKTNRQDSISSDLSSMTVDSDGNPENEWVVWNKIVHQWSTYLKKKPQWLHVNLRFAFSRRTNVRLGYDSKRRSRAFSSVGLAMLSASRKFTSKTEVRRVHEDDVGLWKSHPTRHFSNLSWTRVFQRETRRRPRTFVQCDQSESLDDQRRTSSRFLRLIRYTIVKSVIAKESHLLLAYFSCM